MVFPITISVKADEEAIALAQPNVWNFTSAIRLSGPSLNISVRASPHASEPTVPTPSGLDLTHVPGLRK